jgi:2-polyprenyl-3-methyl-5-hydroxy-6-metoxy-1,4-benzoquinol methylase
VTDKKSTKEYWDNNWDLAGNSYKKSHDNYYWLRLRKELDPIFARLPTKNPPKLIEVGAGASEWLPWLHETYNVDVAGLDYSENGCEKANTILKSHNINGEVKLGDMFNPPNELLGGFDVVCSFGLVEHFSNTADAIKACSQFAKDGGIIITLIPNMTGINGFFYKLLNRKVYDTHLPLTLIDLKKAHLSCGLEIIQETHLLGLTGILDPNRVEGSQLKTKIRRFAHRITKLLWWFEARGLGVPENKLSSPYMLCIAVK